MNQKENLLTNLTMILGGLSLIDKINVMILLGVGITALIMNIMKIKNEKKTLK